MRVSLVHSLEFRWRVKRLNVLADTLDTLHLTLHYYTFVLSIVKLRKSNFEHTHPSLLNIKSAPVSGENPGGHLYETDMDARRLA